MPKLTKHPGLRRHIRVAKSGRAVVYYFLDRRKEGLPDLPLGKDFDEAVKVWDEYRNHRPRIRGTLEEAFKRWEEEVLPEKKSPGTRRDYAQNLKMLRPVFGQATWDGVRFVHLAQYLDQREAKFRANREITLLGQIWHWAMRKGLTELPFPATGKGWKNKEESREFRVTDELFNAVYDEADIVLQDCMDLATATGLRLTDCRTVLCPAEGQPLRVRASKTKKVAEFPVESSVVLTNLVTKRRAIEASHLMLLTTMDGKPVTQAMLRSRYDTARAAAAKKAEEAGDKELAQQIRAMFLRDCRKRAADLAGSLEEASELLQHSTKRLTAVHYRTKATTLKPVR